jgi:hypothetical protein
VRTRRDDFCEQARTLRHAAAAGPVDELEEREDPIRR